VPENQLVYVSLLPQLLTRVGVIENGKPVSYEEMTERLRNEILSLNASFSLNPATTATNWWSAAPATASRNRGGPSSG